MDLMTHLTEIAITPPGIIIILLLITFFAYLRRQWLGAGMLVFSAALLLAMSLPLTALQLMNGLQNFSKPPVLVPMAEKGPQASLFVPEGSQKDPPQAIVVLGGGRYIEAPEYDMADTVSPLQLERLRYAAYLQRKTGLPILVSGGSPGGEDTAEADLMRGVLSEEFHASVRWVERESRTTNENARNSQALLTVDKIRHVYLITHAWHMRRAARAFESAGLKVTSAPTGYFTLSRASRLFGGYLPTARGLYFTSLAIHEHLGLVSEEFQTSDKPPVTPEAASAPVVAPPATTGKSKKK